MRRISEKRDQIQTKQAPTELEQPAICRTPLQRRKGPQTEVTNTEEQADVLSAKGAGCGGIAGGRKLPTATGFGVKFNNAIWVATDVSSRHGNWGRCR
ncbi:hypothetical protein NL676_033109 [Syzygium grande]|nr:hypothetical protein NL676_033109 [Syzygium grande]